MPDEIAQEALKGGIKFKGSDIDFILIVKKGHADQYPMPQAQDPADPSNAGQPKSDMERLEAHFGAEKARELHSLIGDEAFKCLPPRGSKLSQSPSQPPAPPPAQAPQPAPQTPPQQAPVQTPPAQAPPPAAQSPPPPDDVVKKDLEELAAIKEALANKIIGIELVSNPNLDVAERSAALKKLNVNQLSAMLSPENPMQPPSPSQSQAPEGGQGYATSMPMTSPQHAGQDPVTLHEIFNIALQQGVL